MKKLTLEQIEELDKSRLTSQEIFYLKLRTVMTLQEIGDVNGVSRQRVAQVVQEAMEKIEGKHEKT